MEIERNRGLTPPARRGLPIRTRTICYLARERSLFARRSIRMATRPLRTFTVLPNLPPELQGLQELAYNLWWCWNHDAIALLRRIDEKQFEIAEHSPVKLLASVDQGRLEKLRDDEG